MASPVHRTRVRQGQGCSRPIGCGRTRTGGSTSCEEVSSQSRLPKAVLLLVVVRRCLSGGVRSIPPLHLGTAPLRQRAARRSGWISPQRVGLDRKSTRLNSSHEWISYAVFCL